MTRAAIKARLRREWSPEYTPEEIVPPEVSPDTVSERATNVSLRDILGDEVMVRKTKVRPRSSTSSAHHAGVLLC